MSEVFKSFLKIAPGLSFASRINNRVLKVLPGWERSSSVNQTSQCPGAPLTVSFPPGEEDKKKGNVLRLGQEWDGHHLLYFEDLIWRKKSSSFFSIFYLQACWTRFLHYSLKPLTGKVLLWDSAPHNHNDWPGTLYTWSPITFTKFMLMMEKIK